MDQLREFGTLLARKAELQRDLDSIRRSLAERRENVLEAMADAGIKRVTLEDLGTLYLHRQGWARVKDRDTLTSAMKQAGLGDMVEEKVNTNTLSALYREWANTGEPAPKELTGIVEYEVVDDVRLRQS